MAISTKRTAILKKIRNLNRYTKEYLFEITQKGFNFEPGQNISIDTKQKAFRFYSLISLPSKLPFFKLLVDLRGEGPGTIFFKKINVGDEMSFLGPFGEMLLPSSKILKSCKLNKIYFISTGSGIAPFISLINSLKEKVGKKTLPVDVSILWGVSETKDVYDTDFWKNAFTLCGEELIFAITREEISKIHKKRWPYISFYKGRVTKFLKNTKLEVEKTIFFVCGGPDVVIDIVAVLREKGISQQSIIIEKY